MFGLFLGGIVVGVLVTIGLLKMTASNEPTGCIAVVTILILLLLSALILVPKLLLGI